MSLILKPAIFIREPRLEDTENFLEAMHLSQTLHHPWVNSPQTKQEFNDYIQRSQRDNQKCFLVCGEAGDIVGVFNISEIVRGFFQSAYLGFYATTRFVGQGYMSAGLKLVLQHIFEILKLHRIEANIQPENTPSISLIKNNGFRKEGYSIGYLKINGEWHDHERWAMTYEDWQGHDHPLINPAV